MNINKLKISKNYLILFLLIVVILLYFLFKNQHERNKAMAIEPIAINLLTSTHPNLPWSFEPLQSKLFVKPGDVTIVEYIVENFGDKESTGVATFQYFPKQYEDYIKKINCFCYDAKNLKAKDKEKYTFVMFIDPMATKDSKTKNIKEITIQFTFFDHKEYKEIEN